MLSRIDATAARAVHAAPTLAAAAEFGIALSDMGDLPSLLDLLHGNLKWLLPMQRLALCLLAPDGCTYNVSGAGTGTADYPICNDLPSWVLANGACLDVCDLADTGQLPPGSDAPRWWPRTGALLALPLQVEHHIFGALLIGSARAGAYREVDRGLVRLLTLQVAAAVQRVQLLAELDGAQAVIAAMARAVEAKDRYTHGHAARVTAYALALCAAAGLPGRVLETVRQAGPLHDVGKIGVPDAVLAKAGPLTDEEFALIRLHPAIGDEICRPLRSLQHIRAGVRHHHERYDGQGYPDRLRAEDIPLEARVLAIADAFDAMTSNRPYRPGMPVARALAIIGANSGPQWDPDLVPIFCALPLDTGLFEVG